MGLLHQNIIEKNIEDRENKMDNFLKSKYFNLALAILNGYLAINSAVTGSWFWFILASFFAAICFKNYLKN